MYLYEYNNITYNQPIGYMTYLSMVTLSFSIVVPIFGMI